MHATKADNDPTLQDAIFIFFVKIESWMVEGVDFSIILVYEAVGDDDSFFD